MRIGIRIIILGLVLLMFSAPAMAADITPYIDEVEVTGLFTLVKGQSYDIYAHFTDWNSNEKEWYLRIEDINGDILDSIDYSNSEYATEWYSNRGDAYVVTVESNWPYEVWLCAYCSEISTTKRKQLLISEQSGEVTPEPMTLAMTAMGILLVIGFVYKRKEE